MESDTFTRVKERLARQPRSWLVTGAAGFIGSNLVEFLLRLGQTVRGLDNFATGYDRNLKDVLESVPDGGERFSFIEGDICNEQTCREACRGVDYVLHQAALGSVPRSIEKPAATNATNIDGFLNMLVAARDAGVERFVFASSSSVYGDDDRLPKQEEHTGTPLSPYAVTKQVNEMYAHIFQRHYGLESIGLRYFNVFGPRQDPDGAYAAVVPKWIGRLLQGETCYINGDGETSRDFSYVENAVQANLLAARAEADAAGAIYNVGCNAQVTLNELFDLLRQKLQGYDERIDEHIASASPAHRDFRSGDVRHSRARISKAKRALGYHPTHDAEEGLTETVAWYVNQQRHAIPAE